MIYRYCWPLAAVLALAGCASPTKPTPAPVATPAAPAPAVRPAADQGPKADDGLNAVAWAQTAVEHDLVYREVYRNAREKLLKALRTPGWDALEHSERQNKLKGLKPAVVLDVDETVLDNSPYQARLVRAHKEYNEASWAAWVKEEKAKALPGAVAFTQFAAKHGIAVIYITNRAKDLDTYTLANLRKAGFPVSGPQAFLGLGTYVKGCEQIGTQKTCRRQLIARKYRVLMQFGDQLGDFMTVYDNSPAGTRRAVKPYLDWIGQRWFVLPNVTYGSWQPALFNNDWAQPRKVRRQMMLDKLHYN
ncbi:HAD family acid phosphatase [Oleiagrimonas sp. C23AA]|uniref:5'-nucleotidase, lipoprotein e(P4) family n=1 Tax=Oleiagrimonas sp. C23AA TaxID=2719047 RepID=UPI00142374A9|nr:HAD family acid phosphatase [Oleiagrimonas sp. C23AA]NII10749.1 acid phosphatase [Oleiagrimonas sp. C23AA]